MTAMDAIGETSPADDRDPRHAARRPRSRRGWWAAIAVVFVLPGCGGSAPPAVATHPAGGTVTLPGGGPATEGLVEFKSHDNPSLMVNGQIQSEGRFTITTRVEGQSLPGAVAGLHDVTIIVSLADPGGVQGIPKTIRLPEPLRVDADQENVFEIDLASQTVKKRPARNGT